MFSYTGGVPAAIRSPSCGSGTTATVCLLRRDSELVVAQVGDSRATLCRNGVGQILTADHSPDDPRELERILRCSGHVTQTSVGRPRVNGILEMTRSIGDIRLKQFGVTAEPDIVTIKVSAWTMCSNLTSALILGGFIIKYKFLLLILLLHIIS